MFKIVLRLFGSLHAVLALLFALAGVALTVIAAKLGWEAVRSGLGIDGAVHLIEALGLLAIATVAIQIAQTIGEEEVMRGAHISAPTRARRYLSRFLVVVIVALAIEGLVAIMKALHGEMSDLRYAAASLLGTGALLAAWALFIRLNVAAEQLEPESIEHAREEDEKVE